MSSFVRKSFPYSVERNRCLSNQYTLCFSFYTFDSNRTVGVYPAKQHYIFTQQKHCLYNVFILKIELSLIHAFFFQSTVQVTVAYPNLKSNSSVTGTGKAIFHNIMISHNTYFEGIRFPQYDK